MTLERVLAMLGALTVLLLGIGIVTVYGVRRRLLRRVQGLKVWPPITPVWMLCNAHGLLAVGIGALTVPRATRRTLEDSYLAWLIASRRLTPDQLVQLVSGLEEEQEDP